LKRHRALRRQRRRDQHPSTGEPPTFTTATHWFAVDESSSRVVHATLAVLVGALGHPVLAAPGVHVIVDFTEQYRSVENCAWMQIPSPQSASDRHGAQKLPSPLHVPARGWHTGAPWSSSAPLHTASSAQFASVLQGGAQ
jgi:hypothetical protein